MAETEIAEGEHGTDVEARLLGEVVGDPAGPTLLCVAGIHGNEPAGVHGVLRVLSRLEGREGELRGRFVALAGNVSALREGRRFVDRDLNRAWTAARLADLRAGGSHTPTVEDREQMELLAEIERVIRSASGPMYALDLHTTSGPGGIFSAFTDSLPHRAFADDFPIPMIFGLEELVDGTLLNLLSEHGVVALTVETGQHEEPKAIDRAEAAIWLALGSAGVVAPTAMPAPAELRSILGADSASLPRALEMRYKRDVEDGDGFVMRPGYRNFDSVREGDTVAEDADGQVVLAESGRLLMPLYQEQGEDGFFLVREFSTFWMSVSLGMRRVGLSRLATWLPGVRRVPGTTDEVIIDRRVARFFARQLFHLLGFRQLEDRGRHLVMRRRRFDEGRYLRRPPEPSSP
ncbi:MAG: succinylglutamate desuccinylase/aspartoacylase family protein [Gemmatimonadota bacterium]